MGNLASVAYNLTAHKPKKHELQNLVKELYEKYPEEDYILGQLYNHFMPSVPKKAKTEWGWVALAMGKHDVRDYLNYIHVDEKYITATDGHRVHRIPNSNGLESGFYYANGDKVHDSDWNNYPEVNRIIPYHKRITTISLKAQEIVEIGKDIVAFKLKLQGDNCINEIGINKQYLENLANSNDEIEIWYGKGNECIHHKSDNREGVVMPMRL